MGLELLQSLDEHNSHEVLFPEAVVVVDSLVELGFRVYLLHMVA
jgi:hypothetical protein